MRNYKVIKSEATTGIVLAADGTYAKGGPETDVVEQCGTPFSSMHDAAEFARAIVEKNPQIECVIYEGTEVVDTLRANQPESEPTKCTSGGLWRRLFARVQTKRPR